MAKKKAIKLAAASAVAASAFVAAAPAQTDAASNVAVEVSKAVTQMKKAYHTYSDVTAQGKFAPIADVYKEYNAAKKAYANAKALVNKAGGADKDKHLAALEDTYAEYIAKRVITYIDAYNYATTLQDKQIALEEALKNKDWDAAEKQYHAISYELKTRTVILDRVYGKSTRELLRGSFKADAQAARDSIQNEVSVKIYFDKAEGLLNDGKLEEAKAAMDHVADYVAKLDKDTDFGAALLAKVAAAKEKYEELSVPAVKSVSAINATQVEVKFNTPISKASLFADGKSGAFKDTATVTFTTLTADNVPSGNLTGELSADGKTLTITSANALSKRYDAVINGLKGVNGKDLVKFQQVVSIAADTTAPAIVSTTKSSASTFVVKFSEPVKGLGTVTYKLADGSDVAVTEDFAQGAQEVTFTLPANLDAGKVVTATFVGAQDQAGNLLTPNPATVSFVKGNKDGVAPTISSITQTGAKTFAVKFSEELLSAPTVKIGAANASKVEKDSKDATVYNVTAADVLDGTATVAISSFTDLSGEAGTDVSRVVTFVKETAAPKVASSTVVADATNKKQYLEVTFDKDVVLNNATVAATGSFVKDFVTNPFSSTGAVSYKDENTSKKVVRVELDTFLGDTTTDVKGAVYSLELTFTGVSSSANVAADTAKVSFTRGEDGVASNAEVVGIIDGGVVQGADNNKVSVTFDRAVDGASATNVANYSIAGAVVESVTLNPIDPDTKNQTAIVNLKANSNTFTGVRNITISGVKALGSTKVMETYFTNQVELKENVAPTVTSAKLTAVGEITLTFSEAVKQADASKVDFEVLIGGKSQAVAETVDSGLTTEAVKTIAVSIADIDADKLAKGVSLKALTTLDIVDAAGNKLSVPSNIVVSN